MMGKNATKMKTKRSGDVARAGAADAAAVSVSSFLDPECSSTRPLVPFSPVSRQRGERTAYFPSR